MDSIGKLERKREARRRLRAQRQRAGLLRSRVIVVSLLSFALLWGVVFVQMATGNDPVLGNSSARVATSRRSRAGDRARGNADEIPAEADVSTDSEEAAAKAVETAEPEEVEPQPEEVEPEPIEAEVAEPEPEPVPVMTSQS
jgi:outer membrane biosynthesis protein TonB